MKYDEHWWKLMKHDEICHKLMPHFNWFQLIMKPDSLIFLQLILKPTHFMPWQNSQHWIRSPNSKQRCLPVFRVIDSSSNSSFFWKKYDMYYVMYILKKYDMYYVYIVYSLIAFMCHRFLCTLWKLSAKYSCRCKCISYIMILCLGALPHHPMVWYLPAVVVWLWW